MKRNAENFTQVVDTRFKQMEELNKQVNERLDGHDKKFDALEKQITDAVKIASEAKATARATRGTSGSSSGSTSDGERVKYVLGGWKARVGRSRMLTDVDLVKQKLADDEYLCAAFSEQCFSQIAIYGNENVVCFGKLSGHEQLNRMRSSIARIPEEEQGIFADGGCPLDCQRSAEGRPHQRKTLASTTGDLQREEH